MEKRLFDTPSPELPYDYLIGIYRDYPRPEEKIKYLVHKGDLVRIKRGLYVLSPQYGKLVSTYMLAEMVYWPSYISMQSALKFYGLIPESVFGVIGVTTKRPNSQATPFGNFTYHRSSLHEFLWGIRMQPIDQHRQVRVASPLKALFDLIRFNVLNYGRKSDQDLFEYIDLMRIDFEEFTIIRSDFEGLNSSKSKRIREFLLQMISHYQLEIS
jgi:hypothetical protein